MTSRMSLDEISMFHQPYDSSALDSLCAYALAKVLPHIAQGNGFSRVSTFSQHRVV